MRMSRMFFARNILNFAKILSGNRALFGLFNLKVLLIERRYLFGTKNSEIDFKFDLDFHQELFRSTRLLACTFL